MAKNKVKFQKGDSLSEIFRDYGTEEQCSEALFNWKWPKGFVCPQCTSPSLTSNTLFSGTKLSIKTWFLAIYLPIQSKTGLSSLALKRQLGVSYNTVINKT